MTKRHTLFSGLLPFAFMIAGCASSPTGSAQGLLFLDVESVAYGKTSSVELVAKLGSPTRIAHLKNGLDVWSYSENHKDVGLVQRANFGVDPISKRVESVTWILLPDEPFTKISEVLAHFPNAKFTNSPVGLVAGHRHSQDRVYTDSIRGLSFDVNSYHQTVQSISFSPPSQPAFGARNR